VQEVEPRVQDMTSRGSNLNVRLPQPVEENCMSPVSLVPSDLHLAACALSHLLVSPEKLGLMEYCNFRRAGRRLMPEGTNLNLRKLLPLLVAVSILFFHGYHSPAECYCCTQILAIEGLFPYCLGKPNNLLSV